LGERVEGGDGEGAAAEAPARRRRRRGGRGRRRRGSGEGQLDAAPRDQQAEPGERMDDTTPPRASEADERPEVADSFTTSFAEGKAPHRRTRRRRGQHPRDSEGPSGTPATEAQEEPLARTAPTPQPSDSFGPEAEAGTELAPQGDGTAMGRRPRRRARRTRRRGGSGSAADGGDSDGSGAVGVAASAEAGANND
jgi:ribonuclease E